VRIVLSDPCTPASEQNDDDLEEGAMEVKSHRLSFVRLCAHPWLHLAVAEHPPFDLGVA
jgi:hypothetical protein